MINAKIIVNDNNQIKKIFEPELKKSKTERAFYKIEKKGKKIVFDIEAKDFVALRAMLNSITKLLEVNYKIRRLR
jgi:tRNA threonylcarbamoyladenosine modification (KEOPS) complex  Pcc1 subunit